MSVTRCQSELADFVPYRRIEFYALIQGQIYLLLPSLQVTKKKMNEEEKLKDFWSNPILAFFVRFSDF